MPASALVEVRPCPRCGRPFRPEPGRALTGLTGHARCRLSRELEEDLFDLFARFPRLTVARLAADFGVDLRTMDACLVAVQRRRGLSAPRGTSLRLFAPHARGATP